MAGSGQRATKQTNGGMRIDEHASFCGNSTEENPLPMGCKMKRVESCEGGGSLMKYEDTNSKIVGSQNEGVRKAKAHQGRLPEYRN
jgi:hypothetical protein